MSETVEPAVAKGKTRLLIVDDEPDMLDFLERVFRRDYVVIRARSVDEAEVELARQEVDVVVTDRRMPRRHGLELLELVARNHPSTIRVLLTGYADSAVNESVSQMSLVDAWVQKPIDSQALRQTVADAVLLRKTGRSG